MDFVIVAGPTGAGKTHLLEKLALFVLEKHQSQMREEPSILPCIATIAVADGARQFGWARFWRNALAALRDPFASSRPERGVEGPPRLYPTESMTTSQLREQVEAELKLRCTKVWIVDEAQHMLLGGKGGEPGDQFDVLKSVAQLTGVKIVLCGTYQLPSLLAYSGQVMRRSATVDLRRYDFSEKKELIEFISVVQALLSSLPTEVYPDVKKHCQDFYFGTLGCIGVLKDWIARAWALSCFEGSAGLTIEHFSSTRLPQETLREMNIEIVAGESRGSASLEDEYRTEVVAVPRRTASCLAGKPKRRPGQRSPGRDKVGPVSKPGVRGAKND